MTWPVKRVPKAALAVALALGGCGGGDAQPSQYELEATRTCLERADVEVTSRNLDFVASTALGGAVNVRFPGRTNEVTLSFGESEEDADRIEQAYRRFAQKRVRIGDVLRRNRNVVLLWGVTPTEQQETTVGGCLRA